MRLKPPKKCKTPYGGRISYILPGKNKLTVHLKDKYKIRHRKRWSQVMYLYYLLGYRLMMKVEEQGRKVLYSPFLSPFLNLIDFHTRTTSAGGLYIV